MVLKQLLIAFLWQLFPGPTAFALGQQLETPVTLSVVRQTSYSFATPGASQAFELVGTGTDGATTMIDRVFVSEYVIIDNAASTTFLSTATAVSTYTQTFVAAGQSGYQVIYNPTDSGAEAVSLSCAFQGQDNGQCVEKDWIAGQTSTHTTTFTGPPVPYWTVTSFDAAAAAAADPTGTRTQTSQTSTSTSGRNSGASQDIPSRLIIISLMVFIYALAM